jgi:hypothetical protein
VARSDHWGVAEVPFTVLSLHQFHTRAYYQHPIRLQQRVSLLALPRRLQILKQILLRSVRYHRTLLILGAFGCICTYACPFAFRRIVGFSTLLIPAIITYIQQGTVGTFCSAESETEDFF